MVAPSMEADGESTGLEGVNVVGEGQGYYRSGYLYAKFTSIREKSRHDKKRSKKLDARKLHRLF